MSNNDDVCPVCGLSYVDFKTGLTFAEVKSDMYVASEDPGDWVYKRRRCVLRRWHKIKRIMWDIHLKECNDKVIESEEQFLAKDFTEY